MFFRLESNAANVDGVAAHQALWDILNQNSNALRGVQTHKKECTSMSEYQFHDFLAMDEPLSSDDIDALRHISTRARITSVSFTNHYNWGDLKAEPIELMKRFFDAYVYVAHWGTACFYLRIPLEFFSQDMFQGLESMDAFTTKKIDSYWFLCWEFNDSEGDSFFEGEDGEDWMSRLRPIREEIKRGDFRSLYIGWLAGISQDELEDDDVEPFPPMTMFPKHGRSVTANIKSPYIGL
ncbi:MAG: hypothetical protein PHO79_05835 [Desulfoplanes sp.]|nr:hypothetical protein [Desulfoplanes sp.]MDD4649521.1 hypothetical protein [Desulfoplanes sp.]